MFEPPLQDDSNVAGNVHGGTILKMVDQVGSLTATKFANQDGGGMKEPGVAALARIESMDFLQPMYVGELSHLRGQVTYTTAHSVEVEVCVWAENPLTGAKRLTNRARCWYVLTPVSGAANKDRPGRLTPLEVPALIYPSEEARERGARRHELQRQTRSAASQRLAQIREREEHPEVRGPSGRELKGGRVRDAQTALQQLMLPSDCFSTGMVQAGTIMKLMDTASGITACRHCHTNVVTASLEAIDFYAPIFNGDVVTLEAKPIFSSSRSLVIAVEVWAENLITSKRVLANTGIFTFVSLDKRGKVIPIKPLVLVGPFTTATDLTRTYL